MIPARIMLALDAAIGLLAKLSLEGRLKPDESATLSQILEDLRHDD